MMFENTFVETAHVAQNLLLFGLVITALMLVPAAMEYWKIRTAAVRRCGDESVEPVFPVASTREALGFSQSLLAVTACNAPRFVSVPADFDHDGMWRAVTERPLAALVCAASQQPRPLAWLEHTVLQLGSSDQDAGWGAAVEAVAAVDSTLCQWVKNASAMSRRQRDSVAITMRDAVERYAAARR